jgi:hypothetical protein
LLYDSIADRVYCLESDAPRVPVIDCRAIRLLTTIQVGEVPRDLAWNPAQRRVYVSNHDDATLSVIRDSALAGLDEPGSVESRRTPTLVAGVLRLNGASPATLLDISGRRAGDLIPGDNSIRHLPAGIYFVRYSGSRTTAKVVLTR